MYYKSVLGLSPSSFGSRHERSIRLTPPSLLASSIEDSVSRRSSIETLAANNAVSFPGSYGSRPPLYRSAEATAKATPPPTIGFTKPPLEQTQTTTSHETNNNNLFIAQNNNKPGLLSLTLREDTIPPPFNRNVEERECRLADRFVEEPWSLEQVQSRYEVFAQPIVVEAYEIAALAHRGQLRKSGEPVLAHCVETATILADINADAHIIAAALLHDVVDDTCVTFEELRSKVSADVFDLVKKVSKLSYVSQLVRYGFTSMENTSKLKDILIASVDCRAVLIKLADRIHNMRTVSALTITKQNEWAQETMDLFVPLAGRLGCWGIKSELEDLCFAILHPQEYAQLKSIYDTKVARFTEHHLQDVLNAVKSALDEAGVRYRDISGRPKNFYGVFRKMQKKGYQTMDDVLDLFALRIVIEDDASCQEAMEVVRSLWASVPDKLKDYVQRPKPNGYRSIHDVCIVNGVPLEVQIRTMRMHYIAEHGIAAHWRYKESTDVAIASDFVEQRTLWSRYVLSWVFELNDKKFRPESMQESSDVLRSIWNSFWSFEESRRGTIPCQHNGSGARPAQTSSWCPVHVVVKESDALQVCDAPLQSTLEEFLLEHCAILNGDGRVPTVNGNYVAQNYTLQFGDLIEFTDELPVEFDRSLSPNDVPLHHYHQSSIVPFAESRRDPVLPH